MLIINTFSTCFGRHYAHLQETKTCVTARGGLRWFCWIWLVAVVGRCVVGCEHCEGYCSTGLLKMGIMMPETCWEIVDNKHLTVVSCWFSLSLHDLLTMHDHRNLKLSLILFEVDAAVAITNFTSYTNRAVLSANVSKFRGIKFH